MTKQDAIQYIRNAAWLGSNADRDKVEEAVEMAIEALNHSEIPNSSDCIDRAEAQTAIQFAARRYTVAHEAHGEGHVVWSDNLISVTDAMNALREVPSAHPDVPVTNVGDMISRQMAIEAIYNTYDKYGRTAKVEEFASTIKWLPSAQPEKTQLSGESTTKDSTFDCISRQATITEIKNYERDSTAPIDYVKIVEQMPSAQPDARYINATELIKRLQQAGLDDAVSIAVKMAGHERLKHVPSAQPERKRGRWIEYIPEHGKCPFCGNQVDLLNGKANNFCGECGADMRGEQDG